MMWYINISFHGKWPIFFAFWQKNIPSKTKWILTSIACHCSNLFSSTHKTPEIPVSVMDQFFPQYIIISFFYDFCYLNTQCKHLTAIYADIECEENVNGSGTRNMCRIDQVLRLYNHESGHHLLHPVFETENFGYEAMSLKLQDLIKIGRSW